MSKINLPGYKILNIFTKNGHSNRELVLVLKTKGSVYRNKKTRKMSDEQWWRSGESTRLPSIWPRFDNQSWRDVWAEFDDSLFYSVRLFPDYFRSDFSFSSKTLIGPVVRSPIKLILG